MAVPSRVAEIVFETRRGPITLPVAELCAPAEATLLDAVRHAGLPLGQSCRGEGVCRSCTVDLITGGDELGPRTAIELRERRGAPASPPGVRLACQARLPAPGAVARVVVGHPAWGRGPSLATEPGDHGPPDGSPGPAPGASVDP